MGFPFFYDLLIKSVVFWVVTSYSLGSRYQSFGETAVSILVTETDLKMYIPHYSETSAST
jgi:hypothetical protein